MILGSVSAIFWTLFYKHNPACDYRFVILDNYISQDNELPLWKKIPLQLYFLLKKIDVTTEKANNLDYNLVTCEKVPIIFESHNKINLKRVNLETA